MGFISALLERNIKVKDLQLRFEMANKLILAFGGTASAKRFVEKVKKLPYVTYVTDYSRGGSKTNVMVCGDFTPEQEEEIRNMKRGAYR